MIIFRNVVLFFGNSAPAEDACPEDVLMVPDQRTVMVNVTGSA